MRAAAYIETANASDGIVHNDNLFVMTPVHN